MLTSQSQIDALATRIKSLTADLTALEERREQARQRALLDPEDTTMPAPETDSQTHKIDALYSTLSAMDRVIPLLPGILDRLRSMRIVHADAANVTSGINDANSRLQKLEGEVKEWEGAIQRVETALKDVAGHVGTSVQRVEQVVSQLEGRVDKL